MAEGKRSFGLDKATFIDGVRKNLPTAYKGISDDRLLQVIGELNPEVAKLDFAPSATEAQDQDPGAFEAFFRSIQQQLFNAPKIATSTYNIISQKLDNPDTPQHAERVQARKALYEGASSFTDSLVNNDPGLKNYQAWAANDPFKWAKFMDPTGGQFGRVFGQSIASMGTIMATGLLGGAIAGPGGAAAAAGTAAFSMESSEAYGNVYDEGLKRGYTHEEIDRLAGEAGTLYGAGSAVLETVVPFGILRSLGLGSRVASKMFARYNTIYTKRALEAGGKGSVKIASDSWSELVGRNVSIMQRIKTVGGALAIPSLAEAGTEASQFLLEKAITQGMLDGTEVTPEWVMKHVAEPEFSESFAGGLLGGSFFAGPVGIQKAIGVDGRRAADAINTLPQGEARDMLIDAVLNSKDLTPIDKARFIGDIGDQDARRIVEEIDETTQKQKDIADEIAETASKAAKDERGTKSPVDGEVPAQDTSEPPEGIPDVPDDDPSQPLEADIPDLPDFLNPRDDSSRPENVLADILDPQKTVSDRIVGPRELPEQVLDHALNHISEFSRNFKELDEAKQQQTLDLLALGIERTSPKNPEVRNEDGSVNEDALRDVLVFLRSGNFRLDTELSDKGLEGTQVKHFLRKRTKEELARSFGATTVDGKPVAPEKKPALKDTPKKTPAKKSTKPKTSAQKRREKRQARPSRNRFFKPKKREEPSKAAVEHADKVFDGEKDHFTAGEKKHFPKGFEQDKDGRTIGFVKPNTVEELLDVMETNKQTDQDFEDALNNLPDKELKRISEHVGASVTRLKKQSHQFHDDDFHHELFAIVGREKPLEEDVQRAKDIGREIVRDGKFAFVKFIPGDQVIGPNGVTFEVKKAEQSEVHEHMQLLELVALNDDKQFNAFIKGDILNTTNEVVEFLKPKPKDKKQGELDLGVKKAAEKAKKAEEAIKDEGGNTIEHGGVVDDSALDAFQAVDGNENLDNREAQRVIARLKKQFPFIDVRYWENMIKKDGTLLRGRAQFSFDSTLNALKAIVHFSGTKATLDTFPHEFAHIYVHMLRNTDLVQKAIEEAGGEEVLVQRIGEMYADRLKGTVRTRLVKWLKSFINRLKRLFKNSSSVVDELFDQFFHAKITTPELTLAQASFEQLDRQNDKEFQDGLVDDRDGKTYDDLLREMYDDEPGNLMDRYFHRALNVYVSDKLHAKMVEYVKNNQHLSLLDDAHFRKAAKDLLDLVQKEYPGKKLPQPTRQFEEYLKGWWQKTLSTTEVDFDRTSALGRWKNMVLVQKAHGGTGFFSIRQVKTQEVKQANGKVVQVALNPSTQRPYAARELQNFLEEDQKLGAKNKLIYLSARDSIHVQIPSKKNPAGYFFKPGTIFDFSLDSDMVELFNRSLASAWMKGETNMLQFFFAESKGDNSQMLFSIVSPSISNQFKDKPVEEWPAIANRYLENEIKKGNMTEAQAGDMFDSMSLDPANPAMYIQVIGSHERWKSIKGRTYLTRGRIKNISDLFKRLKIDLGKGTVPRGVGNSSVMIVDDTKVDFHVNGTHVAHQRPGGAGYAFDGMTMTSERYMKKLNKAMGNKGWVYKTYIRDLDVTKPDVNGEYNDYIAIKSIELTPPEGLTVSRTENGVRKIIAKYENGTWRDNENKVFDRLVTPNEAKDWAGRYDKMETVHVLPERATRVIKVADSPKMKGAFPILGFELMLDEDFLKNNEAANKVRKAAEKHYRDLAKKYTDKLQSLRDNPKEFAEFMFRELQTGELPSDIQRMIRIAPETLYLPDKISQIIDMLNNEFIKDGLYKARSLEKGRSTFYTLKPNFDIGLMPDEIALSASDVVMFNRALEKSGISSEGRRKSELVPLVNEWLQNNDFWVMVHRTPIQSFAKVVPRKIAKFVEGTHGEVVFQNTHDVFNVHEADFDGDTVFVEDLGDSELMTALREMHKTDSFKERDKIVDLGIFEKGALGKKVASYRDLLATVERNSILNNVQGLVVNAKTALSVLSFKKARFQHGNVVYDTWKPTDRVRMDYFPIGEVSGDQMQVLLDQGDFIEEWQGKLVLNTTKEHELSILLQAAVDNEKFGLFNHLNLDPGELFGWLQQRIWRTEKEHIPPFDDALTNAGIISGYMNMGRLRQGNKDGKRLNFGGNIEESLRIADRYLDADDNKLSAQEISDSVKDQILDDIMNGRSKNKKKAVSDLKAVGFNANTTPLDTLIMQFGIAMNRLNNDESLNYLQFTNFLELADQTRYDKVHQIALSTMQRQRLPIMEDQINSGQGAEIKAGLDMGRKMQAEFIKIFQEIEAEKMRRYGGKVLDNVKVNISLDYSKELADFVNKWLPIWNNSSKIAREWSTVYYLDGGKIDNRHITNVRKLLPAYLMDENVMAVYSKLYRESLYVPEGQLQRPDEQALIEASKMFKRIDKLENKNCG